MVDKKAASNNDTAVMRGTGLSDEELRMVESFDDVVRMTGGQVANIADEMGDGFSVLDDKMRLIGAEFIIVKYGEHESEKSDGGKFTTIHVVTKEGGKYIVNDGSTGIHAQMSEKFGPDGEPFKFLYVPRGLRVSEYTYMDGGREKPARTFYLNTGK